MVTGWEADAIVINCKRLFITGTVIVQKSTEVFAKWQALGSFAVVLLHITG